MAVAAETLYLQQAPEEVSRRTDDILFNVRHLQQNIVDKERGLFAPEAEADVLEQNITEIAENNVHELGPVVRQKRTSLDQQFQSLGGGTINNNIRGVLALDMEDRDNEFEFFRRVEEVTDDEALFIPEVQEAMQAGAQKLFISPAPTHHEADINAAIGFGYDDRAMFRLQTLSPDGLTKTMQSFSVFDVPAKAWAAFLSDKYNATIEPTALSVMQFCNQIILENGSTADILQNFIGGVVDYVDEDDRPNVERQLNGFLEKQAELADHVYFYAKEKLVFHKELALSLDTYARPTIRAMMKQALDNENLNPIDKHLLSERFYGTQLYVDDYVAELATRIKTLTNDNRAGIATANERTMKKLASEIGLGAAIKMSQREQIIQQLPPSENIFMVRRNEQIIIGSGTGCAGGCATAVKSPFSKDVALAGEAGLSGTLYSDKSLDKNSKCGCKNARVLSDGKNVICVSCTSYQVDGQVGNLKKEKKAHKAVAWLASKDTPKSPTQPK